jgi:hypothetical protein
VAVEVAAEEAALSSVLEQVPCQGGILRHPSSAIHVEGFSAIPRSVRGIDMRPGQYRRDASNPNISSLLVTRARVANTLVPKPVPCHKEPHERSPTIACHVATAR